ncbi:transcriptional regulator [Jannaschia pagri]|uniref:Transcriptional regulator n=1 Tax=Jannaschia pagri TaxID=2829797 RepID=A0ABQ4NQU2_9RHOB|nr:MULTISPECIES: MarR family winged helix-turn-helix transcriptional regulator [unclassified Jannaschia]GIT92903.1 transcriptional regulator [Jannaschia sp. AI_61]GIT96738.1 transcriptional regulator [Jannaschia sp. AI_62]
MASDTPPPDTTDRALVANVYALHHALGRYFQASFGETGFTYQKFLALQALHAGGAMPLGKLAQHVGVEPNTLSPMVKKMSSFGLIERTRDPEDERRILLSLLPYGEAVLAEASKVFDAAWQALDVNEDQARTLSQLTDMIRAKLEDAKPPMVFTPPPRSDE